MLLLQNIEGLDSDVAFPPLVGTVFTGYLYRRLLEHIHLSHQHDQSQTSRSYPFWVTHYCLDLLVLDCRARTSRTQPPPEDRVVYLTMQSNLAASRCCCTTRLFPRQRPSPTSPPPSASQMPAWVAGRAMGGACFHPEARGTKGQQPFRPIHPYTCP